MVLPATEAILMSRVGLQGGYLPTRSEDEFFVGVRVAA
jgi:hypothetical protein